MLPPGVTTYALAVALGERGQADNTHSQLPHSSHPASRDPPAVYRVPTRERRAASPATIAPSSSHPDL